VELVANTNARYLSVTPARITYVDLGDHNLNTIDASNQLARLGDLTYTSVHWADPSYGVGEDSTGLFHIIGNGSVTALSAPAPNANTPTLFSVAPNREIYLAIGTKIYHGSASQPFQAFYTADVAPTNIVASNNHVALIYNAGNTNSRQVSITMIDASGNKSSQNIEAYEGSWSPSGAYFATTSDSGTQIFDNSLRQVAAVPNKNVNNLTWLDDKTLFYSLNDRLWRFKLGSDQAEVIAAMDTNHAITEIAPSPDQSYIYLTAQNTAGSNNDLSVYRVGLKGQPVSDAVQQAAAHLPWLVGRCLLSLTNFTSPTIQSYGGQPEDNCPSVARRFVQSLGLDQTKFTYRETLVPPDVPVSQ